MTDKKITIEIFKDFSEKSKILRSQLNELIAECIPNPKDNIYPMINNKGELTFIFNHEAFVAPVDRNAIMEYNNIELVFKIPQ